MLSGTVDFIFKGLPYAGLMLAGVGCWLTYKNGLPWAVAKLKGWWNKGKADIGNLKGDFIALEQRVQKLEQSLQPPANPAPQSAAAPTSEVHA